MKGKFWNIIGYLEIRFAIYASKVFIVLTAMFSIATVLLLYFGYNLAGLISLIAALAQGIMATFYAADERRKYRHFGSHKLNLHTGEIHFRVIDLKGDSKEAIERSACDSYVSIIEKVTKSRGKTVFLITHKTFIRQMFNALRLEGIAEVSNRALDFLMDNMIEYEDFEPIDLTTDERYTVRLVYTGMKQNRLLALRWPWPTKEPLKRYVTPVPYFNLTVSKNV